MRKGVKIGRKSVILGRNFENCYFLNHNYFIVDIGKDIKYYLCVGIKKSCIFYIDSTVVSDVRSRAISQSLGIETEHYKEIFNG